MATVDITKKILIALYFFLVKAKQNSRSIDQIKAQRAYHILDITKSEEYQQANIALTMKPKRLFFYVAAAIIHVLVCVCTIAEIVRFA